MQIINPLVKTQNKNKRYMQFPTLAPNFMRWGLSWPPDSAFPRPCCSTSYCSIAISCDTAPVFGQLDTRDICRRTCRAVSAWWNMDNNALHDMTSKSKHAGIWPSLFSRIRFWLKLPSSFWSLSEGMRNSWTGIHASRWRATNPDLRGLTNTPAPVDIRIQNKDVSSVVTDYMLLLLVICKQNINLVVHI